jgi:hypothetical protein
LVTKESIDLVEQIFGGSITIFEIRVYTVFGKVTQNQNIVSLQLLCNYPRQNGFIEWQKVIFGYLLLGYCLFLELLEYF